MRITCKYCGYSEEYPNGIGWYPGQVGEMCNHILEKHVKFDTDQAMDQDGKLAEVTVGFRIEEMAGDDEMSVSEENVEEDTTMKLACKYCGYSSMDREDVRLHVEEEHPEELDRDRVVIDSVEYRPRGILVQFDPEGEAS